MTAVIRAWRKPYFEDRAKTTPVWARIPWLYHDNLLLSPLPRRSRPIRLDFLEQCALQRVRELVRRAGRLDGDVWIYPGDDIEEGRVVAAGVGQITGAWLCRRAADNLVLAAA